MKKLAMFGVAALLSLTLILSSLTAVESQIPAEAKLSNVIFTPGANVNSVVTVGNIDRVTPTANSNGQSPFFGYSPGTYTIKLIEPDGFDLVQAFCNFQRSDGTMVPIGTFNGVNLISGVTLSTSSVTICTWILEKEDTLEDNISQLSVQIEETTQIREQLLQEKAAIENQIQNLEQEIQEKESQLSLLKQKLQEIVNKL